MEFFLSWCRTWRNDPGFEEQNFLLWSTAFKLFPLTVWNIIAPDKPLVMAEWGVWQILSSKQLKAKKNDKKQPFQYYRSPKAYNNVRSIYAWTIAEYWVEIVGVYGIFAWCYQEPSSSIGTDVLPEQSRP